MIVARVGAALPGIWTSSGPITSGPASASAGSGSAPAPGTIVTPRACLPIANNSYLNVQPGPLLLAEGGYEVPPGSFVGSKFLGVLVESFARPVPAAVFATASQDALACRKYTETDSGVSSVWTVRVVPIRGLTVPAWRVDRSTTQTGNGVTQSESITWVIIGIGHNLIEINQDTDLYGKLVRPDETAIGDAIRAVTGSP